MAIDWATTIATVTGALISGIIGILYSEYRTRRDQIHELESWYTQLISLAERTERVASEDFDAEPGYIRNSVAGNLGKLTSHILNAPDGINDDVILEAEKLAEECQCLQSMNTPSDGIIKFYDREQFLEQARTAANKAEEARANTGWL